MKKWMPLLLACLLLISLMAGCAKTDTPTPPATEPTDTQETQKPADTTTPADTDKEPAQTDTPAASEPTDDSWLPLVDEPEHISMWSAYTSKVDPNLGIADRERALSSIRDGSALLII